MKPKKAATPASSSSTAAKPSTTTTPTGSSDIFSQNKKQHLKDLENKALEKENKKANSGLSSLANAPSFKTGGQLPTLDDDFPPVGGTKKAAVKFND